tara:strand:- start:242 stop:823 length:582 start_codon:yes stop_codon:yes gene_type:complete
MKSLYLLILLLLISTVSISQETKKDTLSIEGKFDLIYKTSSSYKDFKVIRKSRFQNLKNDVLDSIRKIDHELQLNNNKNTVLKDSLKNVNEVLGILDLDMKLLITKKNSISFLGIQLNKSTYTITVWSIILLLIIALFYFIYQYKNSYSILSEAKSNLSETEEELTIYKKKSLEREQKLRRQLQDEINKQRGV